MTNNTTLVAPCSFLSKPHEHIKNAQGYYVCAVSGLWYSEWYLAIRAAKGESNG